MDVLRTINIKKDGEKFYLELSPDLINKLKVEEGDAINVRFRSEYQMLSSKFKDYKKEFKEK